MISEETSKRIISLRFILSVLIVFIHNCYNLEYSTTYGELVFNQSKAGDWIQCFISYGVANCAVPLFFLFAAYIQARKSDPYIVLLKKKVKSLCVPYLIWTLLYFFYYTVVYKKNNDADWWTFKNIIHYLFGFSDTYGGLPEAAVHFWFIRELIILTLISPVLVFLIKKIRLLFLLCVFVIESAVEVKYMPYLMSSLLYYSLGLYWALYDFDLFKFVDKIKFWEIIPVFVLSFVVDKIQDLEVLNKLMLFSICVIALKCSKQLITNEVVYNKLAYLSGFSFFLYVIHMPVILDHARFLWLRFFPMKNTFFCLFEYFGVSILTIVIGTSIGILLRKICPPLFSLLSGGRK